MFDRLKKINESIRRTRDTFFDQVADLFEAGEIDESLYEQLEELLVQADVGVDTTDYILQQLRQRIKAERIRDPRQAKQVLARVLIEVLKSPKASPQLNLEPARLNAILIVGVNGTGKTTSIAKLAHYLKQQGYRPIIAAADTFRAAAIDQVKIWGERAGTHVVSHQPGSDPGAVVYDALQAGQARQANALIIDTAGRLHTKFNLMEELKKIKRVLSKWDPEAPHEVLLVLDATTGQNAIIQAREFMSAVGVDGIVLAKPDGTAKGGVAFAIARELGIPIKFVGTGEKIDDLAEFDPQAFVASLLEHGS